jgi:two-component system, chemotaxis family, CheB/CheR fusion protein
MSKSLKTRNLRNGAGQQAARNGRPAPESRPGSPARDSGGKRQAWDPTGSLFPIVGIGASAGGFEAISRLLRNLPTDTGLAFVLIQHLDPTHKSILAELLAKVTQMPVQQVKHGMPLKPNQVFVVPPNVSMIVENSLLKLIPRQETRGLHMPIDHFFRSLAQNHEGRAIGVILSGTGSDGTFGLEEIKEKGGVTFAQDERTAKFSGMPHSAIQTGSVDFVLSVEGIARELLRIARHSYFTAAPRPIETPAPAPEAADPLDQIFKMLRGGLGTDFRYYKNSTVLRRITRRMTLRKLDRLEDYAAYLKKNPDELQALYQDLLIKVTSFFRDPATFEALKRTVIPRILERRPPGKPIRVWVPGCATGEEVYSIAICLLESLGDRAAETSIRIFGTDVNEAVLQKARPGLYIENIALDVSPERLRRFFSKADRHFRINKSIREMCTFAKHDLGKDAPFSNVDLISCRNVLIYFEPALQKRVIPLFHYALNPGGFLTLGTSETIGGFSDLFTLIDKKNKICVKIPRTTPTTVDFTSRERRENDVRTRGVEPIKEPFWKEADVYKEADRVLLNSYAPAGVLINEQMEVLQFRGDTGRYLLPAPGKASFNLLGMAREGLLVEIKSAVDQAKKQGVPVLRSGLWLRHEDKSLRVALKVIPLKLALSTPHFMVLFEPSPVPPVEKKGPGGTVRGRAADSRRFSQLTQEHAHLKQELEATKQHRQSIIENHEATNEELKSANEEVLSGNEELQSTNEELETAKEELQSTNEELSTANEELQRRNFDLDLANNDLNNLFNSARLPIVMLGIDLRVRRFTPVAEQALKLAPADIGRPIGHLKLNIQVPDLEPLLLSVIATAGVKELEVQDLRGHWYSMQIRPYKTSENKIDGLVLFFIDIDSVKGAEKLTRALQELKVAKKYGEWVMETLREPLVILDSDFRIISANPAFYETFQVSQEDTEKRSLYILGNGQWDIPELRRLLEEILPQKKIINGYEVEHDFPGIGRRSMLLNARRLDHRDEILLVFEDVTDHKKIQRQLASHAVELEENVLTRTQELTAVNKELEAFCYSVAHDLRTPLRSIVSFSQIIQQNWPEGLDPEMKGYFQKTIKAGARLSNLIDHLLDLSRVTRIKFKRELVDLSSQARAMLTELKNHEPDRRVDFQVAPGVIAEGDFHLLRLALQNLLDNAWKFTANTSQARIEFGREQKDGKTVFFVRDNGAGFDMAYADKLFGIFQRLHDEEEFSGTGGGLATVQRIVQRHGGQIWAEGALGRGATFYFTLEPEASNTAAIGMATGGQG